MRRPTIAGVMPSSRAAAERLPRCATSTNVVSSLKRSIGKYQANELLSSFMLRQYGNRAQRPRSSAQDRAVAALGMETSPLRRIQHEVLRLRLRGDHHRQPLALGFALGARL